MRLPRLRNAFTLVELLIVVGVMGILIALIIPAIQRARNAANTILCRNNLRLLGIALSQYYTSRQSFPPAMNSWGQQYAFLSWESRLLPYLEESNKWSAIQSAFANEPVFWIGPHIPIRSSIMSIFNCPSDNETIGTFGEWSPPAAFTHYLAVSSSKNGLNDGVMFPNSRIKPGEVRDGLSNTIVVGERPASANHRFGWWYAGIGQSWDGCLDSHLSVRQVNQTFYAPTSPLGPYHFQRGDQSDMSSTFHFWSLHPGGAHFLFADGSVRFLSYSADAILPAIASRSGGEPINPHSD